MPSRPAEAEALIEIWVQPRASRNEVAGRRGEAVKIRVAAPPVDGEANETLLQFVAKKLGLPRTAVAIVRGEAGRRKSIRVRGLETDEVAERLGV
jgi:uncharacterized protein (TIGR00251 family)